MAEKTININAPIYNLGGTVNGDIINPVYFQGGKPQMGKTEMVKEALRQIIGAKVKDGAGAKDMIAPYVAAFELGLVDKMNCEQFCEAFGCKVSGSTYSQWTGPVFAPERKDTSPYLYQDSDLNHYKKQFEAM